MPVMAARPIASATISFGLVSIPVKLYAASESSAGVHFNLLHRKTGARLKQQYVDPTTGEKVERAEMVKGYEFAKGQYVMFTDEELKALQERATQTIEITEFVPLRTVDPIYFSATYYLGPDKGGDRAYKLLALALEKSGRAALAKYAARGKGYLVMIRPAHGAILMQQLYYADEIRPISEVPLGDAAVKDAELELALQIVEQAVSEEFRPEQYNDEVRLRMLEAIRQKVDGQEITAAPEEPRAQVIDLMEALKASLAQGQRRPAKPAPLSELAAEAGTRAAARRGPKTRS
jgi:DNA end-binding protein Ku